MTTTLWEWKHCAPQTRSHLVGSHFCSEVKDCRSNEFVLFATYSLPFKRMHRRASVGHLQISDRGVISRKKHTLDLTGLRILLIHVTQFSPKWAEPLLLSHTYTIIYSMSNKSSNYTEKPLQENHISRLTLRISFWIYTF